MLETEGRGHRITKRLRNARPWPYALAHDPFSAPISDPFGVATLGTVSGIDSRGFVLGGQGGYNWQRGYFVGGLELDLSYSAIKGTKALTAASTSPFAAPGTTVSASYSDTFDYLGSARARAGILPWESFLLYATGGLGWTHLTQGTSATTTVPGAMGYTSSSTASSPMSLFGWVAGVGAEASLVTLGAPNLLVRVEYLHYDFGSLPSSSSSFTSGGVTSASTSTSHAITADLVRGGVTFKF